jgi:uncharacterized protein YcaQ
LAWEARFAPESKPSIPAGDGTAGKDNNATRAASQLRRLGHVQIDTISVVERAHHHILWSGDRGYSPGHLPLLEAKPRQAFEYWAHAAAYLPMEDYRFCLPRMKRIAETGHQWFPTDQKIVAAVLERITSEGPLRSSDFKSDEGPRGPWWDWKPAKAALEYLFMSGTLLVAARPGFQKLYDLSERVLPPETDTRFPADDEMGDWYVRRAALGFGVFSEPDVGYNRKDGRGGLREALIRAKETGLLEEVSIQGDENHRYWASTDALQGLSSLQEDAERPLRILSPFDNYIIDRKRASRLLGLEYTMECYVPAAKRKFGYFALPVIWKGLPAGLIDCAVDRKTRTLIIKRAEFHSRKGMKCDGAYSLPRLIQAEAEGSFPAGFKNGLDTELESFARFNHCDAVMEAPCATV